MTTNFRLMAMAAVAMLAMNSCVKEENLNNGDKKGTPVEFEMGVNSVSRTSTPDDGYATTFVEGDEVGIFVYEGENPVVINAPYKRNAEGKWVAQGTVITAEEGKTYNYYAYYPYNAEVTEATSVSLTVASDQTTGYTGSDALMAKSENVTAETTSVQLQYSHAFALVQVSLKGDLAAKNATVTLQNVYPTAALDLKAGTVGTAAGTMGTVAMKACTTNGEDTPFNYRAIVPAQTIAANEAILMTTSNNKNYKFTYSENVPYESGKLRQFDVTLGGATGNTIEIGQGTILDWTDGSDVEGGTGGVEEVIVPVNLITVPITKDTQVTVGGKYSDSALLNMTEEGWFSRYADNYGAGLTFTDNVVTIKMPASGTTGWNHCSFGYHANGPVVGKYKFSCTISSPGNKQVAGGFMIRTSGDDRAVTTEYTVEETPGVRTIHSFTKKVVEGQQDETPSEQKISFTIDFSQKYNGGTSSQIANGLEKTVTEDLTDIYIYIYNNTINSEFSVSNIKLERVTE